jgi:predicted dehydrogenase
VAALYEDCQAMLHTEKIDILSICTPTTHRLSILRAALESGIEIIFCEKPIAYGLEEARQMQWLVDRGKATVFVNYLRRWDPGIQEVASLLKAGQIGHIQHIVAYYGKGILNNGTHIIDLLNLFFGLPLSAQVLRVVDDSYSDADPTVDCVLKYEAEPHDFPVYFMASNYQYFSLFELDIVGTKGRIRIIKNGEQIEVYSVREAKTFPEYSNLGYLRNIPGDLKHALKHAVEELVDVYQGESLQKKCGIEEAIGALTVVEAVKKSLTSGSRAYLNEI